MISAAILKKPQKEGGVIQKGAVVISQPDEVYGLIPEIKDYFYLVERRGWRGMNTSKEADIKLVEDYSTWEETRKNFPNAILLDLAGGDFVDVTKFKPLDIEKRYTGIQISCWEKFKRHELVVQGTSLLPQYKFLKFGHFINRGTLEERLFRGEIINMSRDLGANIDFAYDKLETNEGLPNKSKEINYLINQCSVGILTTEIEGVNRFKMECLSAGVPVIVPSDVSFPTKKHINDQTGLLYEPTPNGLAKAIKYTLNNYQTFKSREYVLNSTGHINSLNKLKKSLNKLCRRDNQIYNFDDIYYDGRNQSLTWDDNVISSIRESIGNLK